MGRIGIWVRANVEEIFLIVTAVLAIFFLTASHMKLVENEKLVDVMVVLLSLVAICIFLEGIDSKKNANEVLSELRKLQGGLTE